MIFTDVLHFAEFVTQNAKRLSEQLNEEPDNICCRIENRYFDSDRIIPDDKETLECANKSEQNDLDFCKNAVILVQQICNNAVELNDIVKKHYPECCSELSTNPLEAAGLESARTIEMFNNILIDLRGRIFSPNSPAYQIVKTQNDPMVCSSFGAIFACFNILGMILSEMPSEIEEICKKTE